MDWAPVVTARPPAGVEAGTLLGAGSRQIADLAGDGTLAVVRPGGRVEVRASRDGVPMRDEDGVTVGRLHEVAGDVDASVGDRAVRGSLRIGGRIAPGRALSATGPMRVGGDIDRSALRAGGELQIEGSATNAALVGGAHSALRGRLHVPLRGVADEIDQMLEMAAQLMRAESRSARVTPARVIRVLRAERFATLEPRLAAARGVLVASQRRWPGLCAGLAAEIEAAHRVLTAPERIHDPFAVLMASAGFLAAAVPARRPMTDVGIRLRSAQSCSIETAGSLRLSGAGATSCDITVGGDLIAAGPGGHVSGGEARVGGRVRVRELSARGDSGMRVLIEDARASEDVLTADVVGPGVEVAVGGRLVRFDRRRTGVRIGVSGGRPVVTAV